MEPLGGMHHVSVREHRTACDWAEEIKYLADVMYPDADKIILVMDNLNTHKSSSLYKRYPAAEARRIIKRLEIHYTPKHGSWLDIAEIELSVMTRQCLSRRIDNIVKLREELSAWESERNTNAAILEKQKKDEAARDTFPEMTIASYEKAFEIEFAHNSTAIEGNTLTLMETKVVLEDGIAIGGKSLREIYEVVNHKKAYQYVKDCIKEGLALDEKSSLNGIELAAWTHAEFVRIHPFLDGNGRTSRLIMNYQLLKNVFLPISVAKEDRLDYYNALDKYAAEGDLQPFMELVATLEEKQLDKYLAHVQEQEMKAPTQTM